MDEELAQVIYYLKRIEGLLAIFLGLAIFEIGGVASRLRKWLWSDE